MIQHSSKLQKARPGDIISAESYNEILRLLRRDIKGPGVSYNPLTGWTIRSARGSSSASSDASGTFVLITDRFGSEVPYRYSATECTFVWVEGEGEVPGAFEWQLVEDDPEIFSNNILNLEEQGHSGPHYSPLLEGDVVMVFAIPSDEDDASLYACMRKHDRGTF